MPSDNRHRLLIVEDDQSLIYLCATILLKAGYEVDLAHNMAEAEHWLAEADYDLVVVDLNLPDGNGLELGTRLQEQGTPFLVMTVRSLPEERVLGFETGAVDYLIKPFMAHELLHRVKRALPPIPRTLKEPVRSLALNSILRLDGNIQALVHRNGRRVSLTPGEYKLLVHLANARGQVLEREDLGQRVGRQVGKGHFRTADVLVFRLRKKLAAFPEFALEIKTVPGVGYRLDIA